MSPYALTWLAILAAGVAVARWVVRRVRERREDAADALQEEKP